MLIVGEKGKLSFSEFRLFVLSTIGFSFLGFHTVYDMYRTMKREFEDFRKKVEEGFEYVTEIDGIKLFRKRK